MKPATTKDILEAFKESSDLLNMSDEELSNLIYTETFNDEEVEESEEEEW